MTMVTPFSVDYTSPNDLKRICNAYAIKLGKFQIDTNSGKGVFIGSRYDEYETTLTSCTCMDYQVRKRSTPSQVRPCKHMIRLALELGYKFPLPEFDPVVALEYDRQEDVDRFQARWLAGQLTTEAYIACLSALEKSAMFAMKEAKRSKRR